MKIIREGRSRGVKNKLGPQARSIIKALGYAYVMGSRLFGKEKNRDVKVLIRIAVLAAQKERP